MADLDTASAKADFNLYEDFVRFKQNITAQLESFTEQQNAARATPVEIQDLESRVAEIESKIASRDEFKDLVSVVSAQEKALSEIEKKQTQEMESRQDFAGRKVFSMRSHAHQHNTLTEVL